MIYALYTSLVFVLVCSNVHLLAINNEPHENNTTNNNNFQFQSVLLTILSIGIRPYNHLSETKMTVDQNSKKIEKSLQESVYLLHLIYGRKF